MSRYEAVQDGEGWYVRDHLIINHFLGRTKYGGWLSSGEANIIAFALNAVAEGKTLTAFPELGPDMQWTGREEERYEAFEDYTGPTEGVAP